MSWLKELARTSTKLAPSPGGWNCQCCASMHPRKDKGEIHRLYRRVSKSLLRKEIVRGEHD